MPRGDRRPWHPSRSSGGGGVQGMHRTLQPSRPFQVHLVTPNPGPGQLPWSNAAAPRHEDPLAAGSTVLRPAAWALGLASGRFPQPRAAQGCCCLLCLPALARYKLLLDMVTSFVEWPLDSPGPFMPCPSPAGTIVQSDRAGESPGEGTARASEVPGYCEGLSEREKLVLTGSSAQRTGRCSPCSCSSSGSGSSPRLPAASRVQQCCLNARQELTHLQQARPGSEGGQPHTPPASRLQVFCPEWFAGPFPSPLQPFALADTGVHASSECCSQVLSTAVTPTLPRSCPLIKHRIRRRLVALGEMLLDWAGSHRTFAFWSMGLAGTPGPSRGQRGKDSHAPPVRIQPLRRCPARLLLDNGSVQKLL